MTEPTLTKTLIKAFAVLIDGGYKTYGDWSFEQMQTKAKLYALLMADDPKITREIVQSTCMRYMRRQVWVWKGGEQSPASMDFPSAPEFREACLQTWHAEFQTLAIGYSQNELGYQIAHTIDIRRNIPEAEKERLIDHARKQLGLPTPEPARELTADELQHAKSLVANMLKLEDL